MNTPHSVRTRFDRAARSYHSRATVQRSVAQRLVSLLPELSKRARILELGCGTGLFTELLVQAYPDAAIMAIDHAPRMIAEARERIGCDVQFLVRDLIEIEDLGNFDLICSASALHWVHELLPVGRAVREALRPAGVLLGSMFLAGTLRELHDLRRELFREKPAPVLLPAFDAVLSAFVEARLLLCHSAQFEVVEYFPSCRDLLRRLQMLGLNGRAAPDYQPLSRGELEVLEREYERRFQAGEGVSASYVGGEFVFRMET